MRVPLGLRLRMMAGRYLPFLKITPPVDREAVHRLRPLRHEQIQWEKTEEGEVLLKVPYRKDRLGKVVGFLVQLPEARAVQLDEVGSFVWGLCDGQHTVDAIVRLTSQEYKMNRRETEISVTAYLQMLAERRFIGLYQRGGSAR